MQNSQEVLANRLIALADVVCALANPNTAKEKAAKILVFCDDGYVSVFHLNNIFDNADVCISRPKQASSP
jgi:nitrogenase subunit NifH